MTQLVLNQRGSSLSVKDGRYRIRTREREFFVPVHTVKSIVLHGGTRVSHEVAMTAIEHETDLLFADRKGFPMGRLWSHRFGSIATVRKQQLVFAASTAGRAWIRGVLNRKLDNQLAVLDLLAALTHDALAGREEARHALERYREKIRVADLGDASEGFAMLRGLEGSAGRVYFTQLNAHLPQPYQFARRSGRGATDAFNCLLNYAYGMLYGQCESALIRAGLDPFIGVMHRDEYNRPVLVYDFIEPYRAWADYVVCHLLLQEVIFDDFFDQEQGQWWLNALGKRLLIGAMNDYLAEVVTLAPPGHEPLARSREQHILLDAHRLATRLKKGVFNA